MSIRFFFVAIMLFAIVLPVCAESENGNSQQSLLLQAGLEAYQEGDYPTALRKLIPLANQGNATAQLRLGVMNDMGQGVVKNAQRAAMRYRQAANQGNAEAQFHLGEKYEFGQGVTQNKPFALKWYIKSAAQKNAAAQAKLGAESRAAAQAVAAELAYWDKVNAKREAEAKVQANLKASQSEQARIAVTVMSARIQPIEVKNVTPHPVPNREITALQAGLEAYQEGDYPTALRKLIPLANQGNATAQLRLGVMNDMGQGVVKNAQRAAMRYRQAANQGNAEAQFHLGEKYEFGQGVTQNKPFALKWYNKSAAQQYRPAQAKLEIDVRKVAQIKLADEANAKASIAARAAEKAKLDVESKISVEEERPKVEPIAQAKVATEVKEVEMVNISDEAKPTELATILQKAKLKADAQTKAEAGTRMANHVKLAAAEITASIKAKALLPDSAKMMIERNLMDWASAWSNKNIHEYLAAYAYYFKPKGLSHELWKKQRAVRISKPKIIEVRLSNISIGVIDDSHARVSFRQHYRSDDYNDEVEKILQMEKQFNRWLIVEELVVDSAN